MQLQNLILAALVVLPFGALGSPIPQGSTVGAVVPNAYIVVLNENISESDFSAHRLWAADLHASSLARIGDTGTTGLKHTYSLGSLKGYSGTFDKATIDEIATRTEVAYVEPDTVVTAQAFVTQTSVPSWGLARISHSTTGTTSYIYDSSAGSNTYAYVIDTGILTSHTDFGGRASWGYNAVSGSSNTDGNGHGTHVSGTIASTTYGVAKLANLIAVKVLDDSGDGTTSGVIAGIQWAASDASSKGRLTNSVASMSLGGTYSASLNKAVESAISAGLTFVVAAGNDDDNAANWSPASVADAITVGATGSTDARPYWSNYGSLLDVFAPGVDITSTWIGSSNSETNTISGTSMATPHVSGLVLYLIALERLSTPAAIRARIVALAKSVVTNAGTGSPTILINNGDGI
ncbi:hypothetical protein RUND412_004540 [Rhizina undulata]